ncbi:MAG: plasmid pRiA4b ORF-3 family protein [Candidatus Sericytochromatia bacterium]
MSDIVYQLKISLNFSEPLIWRRFLVDGDTTLDEFHDLIQTVMGWGNEHLYQFIINDRMYGDGELGTSSQRADSSEVTLGSLIKRPKTTFIYEYDFGDGWEHEIVVEKIRPRSHFDVAFIPFCLEGEQACPLEDCGGIFGYYEILDALKDPAHPQHAEMVEAWGELGSDLDPESFELKWVNDSLRQMMG